MRKDAYAFRRASALLQLRHSVTLDQACQVLRIMDRTSTEAFSDAEKNAVMIVASAWMGGLLSKDLAEELLGQALPKRPPGN